MRRVLSPIFDGLVRGYGGIAGGVFDVRGFDSVNPFLYHYVVSDYISGQGGYIAGD